MTPNKRNARRGKGVRDSPRRPAQKRNASGFFLCHWDDIPPDGYAPLSKCPEVLMAIDRIADLVSSMPIHVMENAENGNRRVYDGLARKLDIDPNPYMSRKTLVAVIVRTLLLEGDGNAVVQVKTSANQKTQWIESLHPVSPGRVGFQSGFPEGYKILIDGVPHDPAGLLHFVFHPSPAQPWRGAGLRVSLRNVVNALAQQSKTKAAFLSSKYSPSIVVRVASDAQELASPEGRELIAKKYIETANAGDPWILPADMMEVQQVKPLTLNDLAISDSVRLDRQSVAAILGVPPYLVGDGAYNQKEWNGFISATLMPLVRGIEQELTRKLILSPTRYIRFDPWSLFAYELGDLSDIGSDLYSHGLMTGNEVRRWLGLPPMDGLDKLVILENYIPSSMIGDQKKLVKKLKGGD